LGALISEEYRALNAELHERRADYGKGSHRALEAIRTACERYDCRTVLDYGCGKGGLRGAFPALQEYDPAIPGKDAEPAPADLVVCMDVLEHVEPGKIDAVLDHIRRLTQKVLSFSICIIPASKTLADGRNAHILLKPSDWWVGKLQEYFHLALCVVTTTHISGTAKPKLYEAKVETISALNEEKRLEHCRANIKRVSKRLREAEAHESKAAIMCFGPSLAWTWRFMAKDADVFSVSGAHKFLIDRGVVPYAHIDCDPREHKARQFGDPHRLVRYWLASCVHPAFLDRLEGQDVSLWHLWNGDETMPLLDELEPGEWCATGGGSVGLRALTLLYALGYRDFEIHGMDCAYLGHDTRYAGKHLGKSHHDMRVRCGDRWFDTSASLVAYAQQFFLTRQALKDATIRFHGDGLLQHMVRLHAQQENS
jgi:hypothetical protein